MPWVCFAVLSCTIATTLTPNRYTQHLFVYIQVAFVYSAFKLIETVFLCRKMYTLPAYARPYKTIAARATILRQNSIELSKNKHKHTQNGTRCHYYFSCTQNLCHSFVLETHSVCVYDNAPQTIISCSTILQLLLLLCVEQFFSYASSTLCIYRTQTLIYMVVYILFIPYADKQQDKTQLTIKVHADIGEHNSVQYTMRIYLMGFVIW